MQIYDSVDIAGILTMLTLLAVCLASWAIVGYRAWRRRQRAPRIYAPPVRDHRSSIIYFKDHVRR